METPSRHSSELADLAESLRREHRFKEATQAAERSLEENSKHARTLLVLGRILYQQGRILEALERLHPLRSILGEDRELKTILDGLEQLSQNRTARTDSAFVTDAMAKLLDQQGYLLQAIGIYCQLFLASEEKKDLWKEILTLRERMEREGSREIRKERIAEEIESLDRWIKKQKEDHGW